MASKTRQPRQPEPSRTEVGTYLTLANGTEVQITGFFLRGFEGWFTVRYPDNYYRETGSSYELPESEIYNARISRKYHA